MSNDQTTALTLARDALRKLPQFVVTETVESCNGNKCRDRWCCGCSGEDEAASAIAESFDALAAGTKALAAIDQALADRARQAPAPVEVSRLANLLDELEQVCRTDGQDYVAHDGVIDKFGHVQRARDAVDAAIASMASTPPVGEVPAHTGRWSTDEIGANLYCDSFSHDLRLTIDGDFEDREARKDCADELVKILNARLAASPAPAASKPDNGDRHGR